jgi:hypothetical protein
VVLEAELVRVLVEWEEESEEPEESELVAA